MLVQHLCENGDSTSYDLPRGFKKPKLNSFRSFPANCGVAPTPDTNMKLNTVSEFALGYSLTPFSSSSSNIQRSKVDLSGNLFVTESNGRKEEWSGNRKNPCCPNGAQHVVAFPAVPLRSLPAVDMKLNPIKSMSSYDEVLKLANTTNNALHKEEEEELWKQESDKLNAVIAEAKEFINLMDSRCSMPKASVADDLLKDSREYKVQLPSFEFDALHSHTSIGEQKQTMETVGHNIRERDQILAESIMLQNKSDSRKKLKYSSGIVPYDQSEQRMALKLFKEELSKLLHNQEKKNVMTLHAEAVERVRQKGLCVSKDNKRIGHIPGIQVGDEFFFRSELVIVGLHFPFSAGIDSVKLNGKRYATSIVNSWCYENKVTSDGILIYYGQGGNPKVSYRAAEDQKLERGNLALHNSMKIGYPVRVIHRRKGRMSDEREYMYVYDGLYKVVKYWPKREEQTQKLVFKFKLQRLLEQPKIRSTNVKMGKRTEKAVCVLKDISKGKEKHPVGVFKAEDDDDMPLPFTYITKNVYPHWYQPVDPISCNCIDGCSDSEQCPCVIKNGGEIPFNEKGALLRAKRTVVYECGPSCKCPPSCMNRVSQHAPGNQFEIIKTNSRGWGVRCRNFITSGSFICEYLGELLGDREAEKRIGNDEYLFDICPSNDEEGQFVECQDGKLKHNGFTLDAAKYGNVSRFINHSCSPNMFSQEVIYDHDDKRIPRIMFFAGKNIPPGQELSYDYNYKPNRVSDENGNIKKKACYCGSCKGSGRLY